MNDVTRRALRSSLFGIVALRALLFIPAGTLDYWQAWLFMAVFVCASGASTIYLAIRDPTAQQQGADPFRDGLEADVGLAAAERPRDVVGSRLPDGHPRPRRCRTAEQQIQGFSPFTGPGRI
jgi:hypothetical protein